MSPSGTCRAGSPPISANILGPRSCGSRSAWRGTTWKCTWLNPSASANSATYVLAQPVTSRSAEVTARRRAQCRRLGRAQLIQRDDVPAGQHDKPSEPSRPERVRDPPVSVEVYPLPWRRVGTPLEGAAEAIAVLSHDSNCQRASVSCHRGRRRVKGLRCSSSRPKAHQPTGRSDERRSYHREGALAVTNAGHRKRQASWRHVTPDRRLRVCQLMRKTPSRIAQIGQFCAIAEGGTAAAVLCCRASRAGYAPPGECLTGGAARGRERG